MFFKSIRFKLALAYVLGVIILAGASLTIATGTLEKSTEDALLKKGFYLSDLFVKMTKESSGIINLSVWKQLEMVFHEHGGEALFIAAVDRRGIIRTHTSSIKQGKKYTFLEGATLQIRPDGSTARKVVRAGVENYEFNVPLIVDGKNMGNIHLALDAYPVVRATSRARFGIITLTVIALILGLPGIYYFSTMITTPLKRLSESITLLPTAGQMEEIKAPRFEETGDLIRKFNTMSQIILEQKKELRHNAIELEESYVATLRLLATVIDARDEYTRGHSTRVAKLSVLLGQRLGLSEAETKHLEISSMFHDVGKIKTPDSILNKKDPLNKEEVHEMMRHTLYGAEILRVVRSLQKHIPAAMYHHEWYDGTGYPNKLKGDQIPRDASIIAIVDAYDAMTTSRPYRPAMTQQEATLELRRCRGTQFHPHMTDTFLELIKEHEGAGQEAYQPL